MIFQGSSLDACGKKNLNRGSWLKIAESFFIFQNVSQAFCIRKAPGIYSFHKESEKVVSKNIPAVITGNPVPTFF